MNKFFQDIREKFNDQLLNNANANKSNRSGVLSAAGGGTRLGGGSGSGSTDLRTVTLDQPGSIGCRVEKNELNSIGACIISHVEPNSAASHAGLQRGDIICNAHCIEKGGEPWTSSSAVLSYDAFLTLVKSNRRPLVLQIRRIGTSSSSAVAAVGSGTAAAAASSSSSSSTPSMSANAEVRRKAVMAAAEARERAHQQKMKPIEKGTKKASTAAATATTTTRAVEINHTPDETKRAIEAAKAGEAGTIAQLGYNPYEVIKGTGNQAQMAIIATTSTTNPLATTTTDTASTQLTHHNTVMSTPLNESFDHAFLLLITSTNHTEKEIVSSLTILRKLILNATTKGLQEEDSDKYRRVRLSNPKIQSAIVAMQGGLDLMFSCGFELVEDNTETYLVYPIDKEIPDWIPMALQRMNDYAEQQRK
jgi:hypothetical protein